MWQWEIKAADGIKVANQKLELQMELRLLIKMGRLFWIVQEGPL